MIIYRDEFYVAINKPAGLLVHRTHIAAEAAQYALQAVREAVGQYVYPIHRLDRPTSGVLLFALDGEAACRLKALFTERQVIKIYRAVVRGYTAEQGRVEHPLKKPRDYFKHPTQYRAAVAQEAISEYERLATTELPFPVRPFDTSRYSLVQLRPLTGRTHQLRRHMARINHPIVGDTRYGDGAHNRAFRQQFDCQRLLLAATQLAFVHPFTGEQVQIEATPTADFLTIAQRVFPQVTTQP